MKTRFRFLALTLSVAVVHLHAQTVIHPQRVMDAGGGSSTAAGLTLRASIGQVAVQGGSAGGFNLEGGFLSVVRGSIIPASTASISVPVTGGWNIVSLPVSSPTPNDSVRRVFEQSATPYAFAFNNGYTQQHVMQNGVGYWIKSLSSYSQTITGTRRDTLTIAVSTGWRMIGSISSSIDTSGAHITPSPSNLRASNVFKYNNGYTVASTIEPGSGYWVKVNGSGSFFMHSTGSLVKPLSEGRKDRESIDELNTITVKDANGGSQTLYFGSAVGSTSDADMYVMPPLPPAGSFDARFESREGGTMVRTYVDEAGASMDFPIAVRTTAYPLEISYNILDAATNVRLEDGMGSVHSVSGEGTMRIISPPDGDVHRLLLRVRNDNESLPTEFALQQNYPNPFNPATTIRYQLPHPAHVTLKIFNVVGQEVVTLVDKLEPAGYKSVKWDAREVASGVYFYRITSTRVDGGADLSDVRKMLLVK